MGINPFYSNLILSFVDLLTFTIFRKVNDPFQGITLMQIFHLWFFGRLAYCHRSRITVNRIFQGQEIIIECNIVIFIPF